MTAADNAQLIKDGYTAFGKGDIAAVLAIFADDIAWHVPGRSPVAGDYHGGQEVVAFFGQLQDRSEGSFRIEIHDVLASDDHVVVLCTELAHRGDKTLSSPSTHVWHVRDGKATEFWGSAYDAYAEDEFWS